MTSAELKRFSEKSTVNFRRTAGDRVHVSGRFIFKSARYDVDGVIDMARRRVEPFRYRFSLNDQRVFDSIMSVAPNVVRTELAFGTATQGTRQLTLRAEPIKRGSLVTGSADGVEILPVISAGCSCKSHADRKRPMLGWNDDGSVKPVTVRLKSRRQAGDIEGLAEVVETTVARVNDGRFGGLFGDIMSCIDFALCMLMCGAEYLWCIVTAVGQPGSDIFIELCSVVSGGCTTLCRFEDAFPS